MKKLLRDLCIAQAVTGEENHLIKFIKTFLDEINVSYTTLPHGDLVVGPTKPVLLFTAHVDEVGFEISKLNKDGTVLIKEIGDIFPWQLSGRDVQIRSKHNAMLHGLVLAPKASDQKLTWNQLSIDLGFTTKKQLEQYGVEEGCKGTYLKHYFEQGEKIFAHTLDNRISVWALLTLIKKFQSQLKRSGIGFAFTSSKELENAGGKKTVTKLKPNYSVSVDSCPHNLCEDVELFDLHSGPHILTKTPDYKIPKEWETILEEVNFHPLNTKSKYILNSEAKIYMDLGIKHTLNYLFPVTSYHHGANTLSKKAIKQSMQGLEKIVKKFL